MLHPDAFIHLPSLRDLLTPPERSELRVTPEVMAFWDERARALGRPPDWRLTDRQIEDSRRALLGELDPARDVWVFSYGSLMWDPGFHFAEVRLADLDGFQRRFSFRSSVGRGSPDNPALMLSLEHCAGQCTGLAFRIPGSIADVETAIVWRREMVRGSYRPLLRRVGTPQGEVMSLVFGPNQEHDDYVGELPLGETARIIASASGVLGSNRQYLEQLAAQLEGLRIDDPYVTDLLARVRTLDR